MTRPDENICDGLHVMPILAILGVIARTNYAFKLELYGYPWKIGSKCRSPVKTVLKKIHPTEFYGQNQKL